MASDSGEVFTFERAAYFPPGSGDLTTRDLKDMLIFVLIQNKAVAVSGWNVALTKNTVRVSVLGEYL